MCTISVVHQINPISTCGQICHVIVTSMRREMRTLGPLSPPDPNGKNSNPLSSALLSNSSPTTTASPTERKAPRSNLEVTILMATSHDEATSRPFSSAPFSSPSHSPPSSSLIRNPSPHPLKAHFWPFPHLHPPIYFPIIRFIRPESHRWIVRAARSKALTAKERRRWPHKKELGLDSEQGRSLTGREAEERKERRGRGGRGRRRGGA